MEKTELTTDAPLRSSLASTEGGLALVNLTDIESYKVLNFNGPGTRGLNPTTFFVIFC